MRRGSYILRASQRESFAAQQAQGYRQRTAIPYEPLSLTFKTITYSVPLPPVSSSLPRMQWLFWRAFEVWGLHRIAFAIG